MTEITDAIVRLLAIRDRVKGAAIEMQAALAEANDAGCGLRQSDFDVVTTRFLTQIPVIIERKVGALLPPITGTFSASLGDVKTGG